MSLATRCTQCGTVFRVVQDQLKVSEGWVRCGRCDEVFNAIEGLFDLERDAPPDWKPPPSQVAPPAAQVSADFPMHAEPPDDDDDVFQLDDDDRVHSRFFQPEMENVDQTPAQTVRKSDRVEFADAQFPTDLVDDAKKKSSELKPMPRIPRSSVKEARAKSAAAMRPDFVRQADERDLWRSPRTRIGLSILSGLLFCVLAGQAIFHFRDGLAAQYPGAEPWLARGCTLLGCDIQPPRRIDEVSVESSALSPAGSGTYKLSVTLRNRGSTVLATPWIDLALTDGSGELVARRALSPREFRSGTTTIAAGGESSMQVLLGAEGRSINGYTVEIFYP